MSINGDAIVLSVREAIAAALLFLSLLGGVSAWAILPHRVNENKTMLQDHELRIRKIEDIRIDLSEMRADIQSIKRKLEKSP